MTKRAIQNGTELRKLKSEKLAYWYLRLNGFLTITNFVVHPDDGSDQLTDVDVVGVRFPHRSELQINPMEDDTLFSDNAGSKPSIILAEVKKDVCNLNKSWTDKNKSNVNRMLRAIGAFPLKEVDAIAAEVYRSGCFCSESHAVSIVCIGSRTNVGIKNRYPRVPQITWDHILPFIYDRFKEYRNQKVSHKQWDPEGHILWNTAEHCVDKKDFVAKTKSMMV